jgi:DNA polymerase-3 subunit delta
LLKKYAEIKEFSLIPPWQTDQILAQLKTVAQEFKLTITRDGYDFLLETVGNNTRLMGTELEKIALFHQTNPGPIDRRFLAQLIHGTSQNTLELGSYLIQGNLSAALGLLAELLHQNEPALRIVATLVGQFRTWTVVKLMAEQGNDDLKAIADLAELKNPKRVYFLKKEIARLRGSQFLGALPVLLELENSLKLGANPEETMEIAIVKIGQLFRSGYGA